MFPAVIRLVETSSDIETVRELMLEYGRSLGFHICFETYEQELADLPGAYAPPGGVLLLARIDDAPAGCIALRKIDEVTAELKRLYVRPEYRGAGAGRRLAEEALRCARAFGYLRVRLDTLPDQMIAAGTLYRSLGFRDTPLSSSDIPDGSTRMELTIAPLH